jgi:hypothetical protein
MEGTVTKEVLLSRNRKQMSPFLERTLSGSDRARLEPTTYSRVQAGFLNFFAAYTKFGKQDSQVKILSLPLSSSLTLSSSSLSLPLLFRFLSLFIQYLLTFVFSYSVNLEIHSFLVLRRRRKRRRRKKREERK